MRDALPFGAVERLSPRPVAVLIEPSAQVMGVLVDALTAEGFEVRTVEGLPPDLADASLIVVEADRGGRAIVLSHAVHGRRPEVPIAGVLRWWNEDERDLADVAGLIVHVPVRDDQIQAFRRFARSARFTARISPN
jgi:hypothetical protein